MNDISVITDDIDTLSKHVIDMKNDPNISVLTVDFYNNGTCINSQTGVSWITRHQIPTGEPYEPIYYEVNFSSTSDIIGSKIIAVFPTYTFDSSYNKYMVNVQWKEFIEPFGSVTLSFMEIRLLGTNYFSIWRHYYAGEWLKLTIFYTQ